MNPEHKALVEALHGYNPPDRTIDEQRQMAEHIQQAAVAIESLYAQVERAEAAVAQLNLQLQIESESNMIVAGERDSLKAERTAAVDAALLWVARLRKLLPSHGTHGEEMINLCESIEGSLRALKPDAGGKVPQSAPPATQTAGMVMVPREPTEAMLTALFRGYTSREDAYRAMLAAGKEG